MDSAKITSKSPFYYYNFEISKKSHTKKLTHNIQYSNYICITDYHVTFKRITAFPSDHSFNFSLIQYTIEYLVLMDTVVPPASTLHLK